MSGGHPDKVNAVRTTLAKVSYQAGQKGAALPSPGRRAASLRRYYQESRRTFSIRSSHWAIGCGRTIDVEEHRGVSPDAARALASKPEEDPEHALRDRQLPAGKRSSHSKLRNQRKTSDEPTHTASRVMTTVHRSPRPVLLQNPRRPRQLGRQPARVLSGGVQSSELVGSRAQGIDAVSVWLPARYALVDY